MKTWKLVFRYAPLALKLLSKYKGDLKLPKNFGLPLPNDEATNWESLANHLQAKVQKRTSEVSRLQTKAGLVVVATAILLQPLILTRFRSVVVAYIAAVSLGLALFFALATLFIGKTSSNSRPDDMVSYLAERPDMSRLQFQKQLAKSYSTTYAQLNETYTRTETILRYSAVSLLVSLALILAAKLAS